MKSAIGIVSPIEKTPQGEAARALTTTSASTARRMIMIEKTAIRAAIPPTVPISSRTI
jgi:ABC-type amino acid transport system permease subunit